MKTLIFLIGLLTCCRPAEVETSENNDKDTSAQIVEVLEPVGVIPNEDCRHVDIGDKPCNFRLTDQNGDTWDLYSHSGSVILLDFSAFWCGPCQVAGAHSQSLQDEYADSDFEMVTILIDGPTPSIEPTEADMEAWVRNSGITTAPVLQGSREKMFDNTGTGLEGYIVGGFPTYIYIGRDMKFYAGHVGFSEEYIRQKIEEGL